jgi:hypothetical protein
MSIERLGIVAVCVVIVLGQMVILVEDQANELGRIHDIERFRKPLRGCLMCSHDHKKAVHPRFDKPTIREGDQWWCIDDHIIVVLPGFLQEFPKARQLQHSIRERHGVAHWQDVKVEWKARVYALLEGMLWLQDCPYQAFSNDVAYAEAGQYGRAA